MTINVSYIRFVAVKRCKSADRNKVIEDFITTDHLRKNFTCELDDNNSFGAIGKSKFAEE